MITLSRLVQILSSGLAVAGLLAANQLCSAEIALPPETARYIESPLPGYAIANAVCSTCHSADYPRMQPPALPRAYWQSAVVKMQKTFGAPIPDDVVPALVDYLVKTYGAERSGADQKVPATAPKRR